MFIDLQKSFDTVNHKILLDKLEHYGIRGTPLQWFSYYLSNRKQFVHVNAWVAGNEVIVKNVNANIPVSLSWLLLPFLALLCFAATAQFTDSSLHWPNGLI